MADTVDATTKYLRLVVLICTLLTIISGVICYVMTNKISIALSPVTHRIAAAEDKLDSHIEISNKCLAAITDKGIFDLTIKGIDKDIKTIKESQEKLSISQTKLNDKIDDLIKIIIKNQGNTGG